MIVLDLPTDIWLYILDNFLSAQDLIRFLQTCRATYNLCTSANVWARKLRETIIENVLFIPSSDCDSISLTDYKRAILAPLRMTEKIETAQITTDMEKSKIRPVAKHVLPITLTSPILMMLLIPGGRYLVVKTTKEIIVMDINSNVEPTQKMRLKNQESERASSIFVASPSKNGNKFRLATVDNPGLTGIETTQVAILEFEPSKRELHRLSSRRLEEIRPDDTNALLADMLAGPLFCYYSNARIVSWNFEQDVLLSWHVDPSLHNHERFRKVDFELMFNNGSDAKSLIFSPKLAVDYVRKYLILFTDQTLLFWDMNEILAFTDSIRIPSFPPKWSTSFRINLFSDPTITAPPILAEFTFICSLNAWYHMDYSLPGFDLLAYEGIDAQVYYHSYEIRYDANKGGEPSVLVTQMHDIPQFQRVETALVTKQSRLCGGKVVLLWENKQLDGLFVLIRRPLVGDEVDNMSASLPLKHTYTSDAELFHPSAYDGSKIFGLDEGKDLVWDRFGASSFDPASGLFCSTANCQTKVVVTDYLGRFGS